MVHIDTDAVTTISYSIHVYFLTRRVLRKSASKVFAEVMGRFFPYKFKARSDTRSIKVVIAPFSFFLII